MVHHFRVVLCTHPCQEFALSLRNSQAVKGFLDVLRHVFPGTTLALRRLDVVVDIIEINGCDIATPGRQWLLEENLQGPQPRVAHPLRLLFDLRDLFDDVLIQTLFGPKHRLIRIVEAKLILTLKGTHFHTFVLCRWRWHLSLLMCIYTEPGIYATGSAYFSRTQS